MKKFLVILTIFLLISLSVPASAETGSVKVIHRNDDGSTTDITKDNHEEGDSKDRGGSSDSAIEPNTLENTGAVITEDSILAAQTAGERALFGFTNGIIDSFYEGSMSIYNTDVSATDEGAVTYNISVRELHPYEHPLVLPAQLVSLVFLILVTFITILGSILVSAFQTKNPEAYGDIKRNISGHYTPYNPKRVHAACVWSITRPVMYLMGFLLFVYGKNFLLSLMSQQSSGVLSADSDNIIIRGITGISIFVSSFQTAIGEYGVYTFGTLLFVICMITDILILFNSEETARKLEYVVWCTFGIFCLCDLINTFCISYGVYTSGWKGESIYITAGIVAGSVLNSVIILIITVYAILKGKKSAGI